MTLVRIRVHPQCPAVSVRPLNRYVTAAGGVHLPTAVRVDLIDGQGVLDLDDAAGGTWIISELTAAGITRVVHVPPSPLTLDYENLADA